MDIRAELEKACLRALGAVYWFITTTAQRLAWYFERIGQMDKSFKAAVAFYKPVAKLSHQQDVMRLYRRYVSISAYIRYS